jgi:CheY-like chemotaxis protein
MPFVSRRPFQQAGGAILLYDDDAASRRYRAELLRSRGYVLDVARTLREAERLRTSGGCAQRWSFAIA